MVPLEMALGYYYYEGVSEGGEGGRFYYYYISVYNLLLIVENSINVENQCFDGFFVEGFLGF